jgi:succinate-acetate transporter protein
MVLRPIGHPLPLGFLGLAAATITLGRQARRQRGARHDRLAVPRHRRLPVDRLAGWKTLAGLVGLVLGPLAVYVALAIEPDETRGEGLLPMGRRNHGAQATGGDLLDQLQEVEHAPGVRRQL